jgi:TRAP-type C4-dicarboxylate transport system substrate-binding protein
MIRLLLLTLLTSAAFAQEKPAPHTLRLASIAPDGTGYAREMRAFAREVESESFGRLKIKLYFGAIAGDELEMDARVKRGQLDGAASAGMMCERLSPSMRVMRMPGLFGDRDEATQVLGRLKPIVDPEFQQNGYVNLGLVMVGPAIIFSRYPTQTIAELNKQRFWAWDADRMMQRLFPMFGLNTVQLPIYEAARAYDEGRHDGFTGPPSAALAFQWSSRARYYIDLEIAYITGCVVVSTTAWDSLPEELRTIVRSAMAKAAARLTEVDRELDRQLLEKLFAKQGLKRLPVTPALRADFERLAKSARAELIKGNDIPAATVDKVQSMLDVARIQRSTHK